MVNFMVQAEQDMNCISRMEADALMNIANQFTKDFPEVFEGRIGRLVIDAQRLKIDNAGTELGMADLKYLPARLVGWIEMPDFRAEAELKPAVPAADFSRAALAIDSLLEGQLLFEGQANRYLEGGIYFPALGVEHMADNDAGRLMVLPATFGRVLIGYVDDKMRIDPTGQSNLLALVIANVLFRMFPFDETLKQSYAWTRRRCGTDWTQVKEMELWVQKVFENEHPCAEKFWAYAKKNPEAVVHMPFRGVEAWELD